MEKQSRAVEEICELLLSEPDTLSHRHIECTRVFLGALSIVVIKTERYFKQ